MRTSWVRAFAILFLGMLWTGVLFAKDVTTITGKTYERVKLLRAERDGLVIQHSCGVTKLPYNILPPDMRESFRRAHPEATLAEQSVVHYEKLSPSLQSIILRQLRSNVRRLPEGDVLTIWSENGVLTQEAVDAGLVALDDVVAEVVAEDEVILKNRKVALMTTGKRRFAEGDTVLGLARPRDDFYEDPPPAASADESGGPSKSLWDKLLSMPGPTSDTLEPRRLRRYELVQTQELRLPDLEDVLKEGHSFAAMLPMDVACSECGGKGEVMLIGKGHKQIFSHYQECADCRGTGLVTGSKMENDQNALSQVGREGKTIRRGRMVSEYKETSLKCPACNGTGRTKVYRDPMKQCPGCHGKGKVALEREVVVVW